KIGVIGALEEEIVVSSLIDYIGPAVDSGVPAVYADAYAHYRAPAVYRALEGALKCCQIGTCCMYHACLVSQIVEPESSRAGGSVRARQRWGAGHGHVLTD